MKPETVLPIIEKYQQHRGGLISILEEIQSKYGYLPDDVLKIVADRTGRALVDIYGVATFYKAFRLTPRGKHLTSVCLGTACHVRGGPVIAEEYQHQLKVRPGGTTDDNEITLETVRCLGACALGPIVVVDGHYFANVTTSQVGAIIERTRSGLDGVESRDDQRIFPLEVSCPQCNHSLMDAIHLVDGVPSIRLTVSFGQEHCALRLSSLYGSYTIEAEGNEIPLGSVANFFCPHCHAELIGAWNCTVCEAPMVPMIVRGGGIVQICSRRGCKSHMLDLERVSV